MNRGNSSNRVHWLYATDTGTATSIEDSMTRGVAPLLAFGTSAQRLRTI